MFKKSYKENTTESSNESFKKILYYYERNVSNMYDSNLELEVKFGTKGIKHLTKIDYDNVIKKLKSLGFISNNEVGINVLRMYNEYLDKNTGKYKMSNIRTEISGTNVIQEYCRTNDLKKIRNEYQNSLLFLKKTPIIYDLIVGDKTEKNMLKNADFDDYNFRISLNQETKMSLSNNIINETINNWDKEKKQFRYLNRVTFFHPDLAINVDISIIKSSTRVGNNLIKTYKTDESGVFTNPEIYNIELEVNNEIFKKKNMNGSQIEKELRDTIKYVLSGLQGTNYPISYKQQKTLLYSYLNLIHGEKINSDKRISNFDFIGPSSVTLQKENIMPINDNIDKSKNIRENYVVTDKADGKRCLMYVADDGKIYLIDMNMNVMFTGALTNERDLRNSILDGELVLHDKYGNFINLYLAFDIYFINREDVRKLGFLLLNTSLEEEKKKKKYRYPLLKSYIKALNPESITKDIISPIRVGYKKFYPNSSEISIFAGCDYILKSIEEGNEYEYETDGLIFTPASFGVGSNKEGESGPLMKITWEYSFKWKPAKFNTIDFLVSTKKAINGTDLITPIFEDGIDTRNTNSLSQYKTLILKCAFDEKKDGFLNPCQDIIDDNIPEYNPKEEFKSKRLPVQFFPTNPYDPQAGICKIMLTPDPTGALQMKTEDNEIFQDSTIVEFRYDMNREGSWRWVPIRVRYDKTTQLKQGLLGFGAPDYGNSYRVANSNWKSIHNEVTETMIRTGSGIPDSILDEDVYYNRDSSNKSVGKTLALRDFHRLFVKNLLITSVSKKGDILIDYACGKAGDLPRWIKAQLSFVFGIDLFKDNLENRLDGACARFLKKRREFKNMPYALFVNGDSRYNIKSGEALLSDKAKQITKAIFGEGPRYEEKLGKGVYRQYGKGLDGFNVSSCQFAIHYFMETQNSLQNFIRNIAECTALNGYFIGTSYDGKLVFDLLKNKKIGESIEIVEDGIKVWEIRKDYEKEEFEDDVSSLGYQISVYQESINKYISEYLVNFDYIKKKRDNKSAH